MKSIRQTLDLLGPGRLGTIGTLILFMCVGMVLETASVGLFIPALAVMTEPDIAANYSEIAPFLAFLGNPGPAGLITWGVSLLVLVYFLKNVFLAALAWWQSKFVFEVQASLSKRLFNGYLRQPYTFHLQRNSSELIRNTTTEVLQFTTKTLMPMMVVATEGLVLLGISSLLLFVEPVGAVVVIATMGLSGFLFYQLFKTRLVKWGKARQVHEGQRLQHIQQGLGGVKDVILLGREDGFLRNFDLHNTGVAHYSQLENVLQHFPRFFLETLAVAGLALLIVAMLAQGRSVESLVPTVGLFGAAAFRIMPVANRVLGSIQRLRFSLPVIGVLHDEITTMERASARGGASNLAPFRSELTLKNVGYSYPSSAHQTLHGINLTISRGMSVGFVGESGAGKSTIVDVILGLLRPTDGVVLMDGADIHSGLRGWQNQIGYVPQSIYLTDDTLRRNIAFGLPDDEIDEDALDRAIDLAQLRSLVDSLPHGKNTVFGERGVRLSGGQLQRVGIARALYHNPSILVLDEATSALDTETERSVMRSIDALRGDKTVIVVAHRLSTVEHCDILFYLERGRVVERGRFADIPRLKK